MQVALAATLTCSNARPAQPQNSPLPFDCGAGHLELRLYCSAPFSASNSASLLLDALLVFPIDCTIIVVQYARQAVYFQCSHAAFIVSS